MPAHTHTHTYTTSCVFPSLPAFLPPTPRTQVAFIDVTSETPVGHGAVLCFSVYGGDDMDFADLDSLQYGSAAASAAAAAGQPQYQQQHQLQAQGLQQGRAQAQGQGQQQQQQQQQRKDRLWVDVWAEVELGPDGRPIMDGRYVSMPGAQGAAVLGRKAHRRGPTPCVQSAASKLPAAAPTRRRHFTHGV